MKNHQMYQLRLKTEKLSRRQPKIVPRKGEAQKIGPKSIEEIQKRIYANVDA